MVASLIEVNNARKQRRNMRACSAVLIQIKKYCVAQPPPAVRFIRVNSFIRIIRGWVLKSVIAFPRCARDVRTDAASVRLCVSWRADGNGPGKDKPPVSYRE